MQTGGSQRISRRILPASSCGRPLPEPNLHICPETSIGQSSPLAGGLLYVTHLESSIDWWCNKLLSPTCPPDVYSERRQFTHVCTTHLDAPTLQEHMPAADAPYYKRSQPDHCAVHSSHRRVAMRVPPFPSISRHAALSHRLAFTRVPAPPSFCGLEWP